MAVLFTQHVPLDLLAVIFVASVRNGPLLAVTN